MTSRSPPREQAPPTGLGLGAARIVVAALIAVPAALLAHDVLFGPLRANPYPTAVRETGLWSLRLLVAGLAITPVRSLTGWRGLAAFRRMVGLSAAAYAAAHLLIWCRDYDFAWRFLAGEIAARPYLAVGVAAALPLAALALTSFAHARRALGETAWHRVHGLAYPTALLAYGHFVMAGRLRFVEIPLLGALLAASLAWRLAEAQRGMRHQ